MAVVRIYPQNPFLIPEGFFTRLGGRGCSALGFEGFSAERVRTCGAGLRERSECGVGVAGAGLKRPGW